MKSFFTFNITFDEEIIKKFRNKPEVKDQRIMITVFSLILYLCLLKKIGSIVEVLTDHADNFASAGFVMKWFPSFVDSLRLVFMSKISTIMRHQYRDVSDFEDMSKLSMLHMLKQKQTHYQEENSYLISLNRNAL